MTLTEIADPPGTTQLESQKPKGRAVAIREPSDFDIINAAAKSGNIEMYREAIALFKEMKAIAARTAFFNALADAKAEIKPVFKNRSVGFDAKNGGDRTEYTYEDLAQIDSIVDPILSQYGLSTTFRVSSPINEPVSVTCILSHRDGHTEESTLTHGRDDDKSNKNSLQRLGSTLTYLQRYAKKAVIGLSASKDDDANGASAPADDDDYLTVSQIKELEALIKEVNADAAKLCAACKVTELRDIHPRNFQKAKDRLEAMREPL
jgi:hypothetical protein